MKKILIALLLATSAFYSNAQDAEQPKLFNHYIGIQANELLKQLINLNTSNTSISNPYLLTYSVLSTKYNWGIETGFGFNYHNFKDNLSPTTPQSKINESFYRFGIFKNFMLGKKWEATTGLDYAGSYQSDKTVTNEVIDFNVTQTDSTATISTSVIKSKGGGLQLGIGFHLSDHILLRTEGTVYYLTTNKKNNVLITETFTDTNFPETDTYTVSSSNSDTKNSDFEITIPVAIFLIIKF
jgi:hypothetical protein